MPLPKAPVSTPGNWVKRKEFPYNKSFGFFECHSCSKTWVSAHAFVKYRQACKDCKQYALARYMWLNPKKDDSDEDDSDEESVTIKNGKPHIKALCEACKKGVCTGGN
jgi:hypothetical protein